MELSMDTASTASEKDSSQRRGRGKVRIQEEAELIPLLSSQTPSEAKSKKKQQVLFKGEEDGDDEPDVPFVKRNKLCVILVSLCVCLLVLFLSVKFRDEDEVSNTQEVRKEAEDQQAKEKAMFPEISRVLSVSYDSTGKSYKLLEDPHDKAATARATYHLNVNQKGWNYFEAKALPADDSVESYLDSLQSMGYLEGYLSRQQIEEFYPNYYQSIFDTKNPELCNPDIRFLKFLQDNYQFMKEKSLKHYKSSEYWLAVRGVLSQLDGMLEGFTQAKHEDQRRHLHSHHKEEDDLHSLELTDMTTPSIMHFLILNGNGDLFTLIEKFAEEDKHRNVTFTGVDCSHARRLSEDGADLPFINEYGTSVTLRKTAKITGKGIQNQNAYRTDHCSALVKLLPDQSDVIFGHNTWDDYRNMGPRIFKHYIHPKWPVLQGEECGGDSQPEECPDLCSAFIAASPPHTYFSSSPGWLTSVDDFYTTFTSPLRPFSSSNGCLCKCHSEKSDVKSELRKESEDESKTNLREMFSISHDDEEGDKRHASTSSSAAGGRGPQRGGRMAVIETSLEIYSPKLYDLIAPTSLLSWVRARVANTLAQNGSDWASRFQFDHSGTYPNQWIVVDFERFDNSASFSASTANDHHNDVSKGVPSSNEKENSAIKSNFLTIVEEMPGLIVSHDQSSQLKEKSYWASYNLPFYEKLSEYSKNKQLCQKQKDIYVHQNVTMEGVNASANSPSENQRLGHSNCYASCSRAKLFDRLQKDIVDIPSAMRVLSHNDYKHDSESFGNPCEEIACREDLQPSDDAMNVFGAIDTKLSSVLEADVVFHESSHATATSKKHLLKNDNKGPLVFPLPDVIHSSFDISTAGGVIPTQPFSYQANPDQCFKQPRFIVRQGPTHDENNPPFCWSTFEARHEAWIERLRAEGKLSEAEGRRLREEGWRKRKPAFRYSHLGQRDCFDYEWGVLPPVQL